MTQSRATRVFSRIDRLEHRWCQQINQGAVFPPVRDYFRLVSWLGNGWFWYAVILSLPVSYGWWGWQLAALMTATGIACTLMYKVLKTLLVRERPFISFPVIQCVTPPLDRYSFPSGHSLHAVCFNALLITHLPVLGWAVLPFTVSVLASRVILGLHYPSDVLAGGLIGLGFAVLTTAMASGLLPGLL